MNCEAMRLSSVKLLDALQERIAIREEIIQKNEKLYGKDHILIKSGGASDCWTKLFGYDFNEIMTDGEFAIEMELRQRIFWIDNVVDDTNQNLIFCPNYPYFDSTFFGQDIIFTKNGIPNFSPHPISKKADISLVGAFDFRTTGAMTTVFQNYEKMSKMAELKYKGNIFIDFPDFIRGPLDMYVQLRGYENFISDTVDSPEFIHDLLAFIVERRGIYSRERLKYLDSQVYKPLVSSQVRVDDDWVNVPYITPDMFREYVLPAYGQIQKNEGSVEWFHTCGNSVPIIQELLHLFTNITMIDVSQSSDPEALDMILPQNLAFLVNVFNTFVLAESENRQRKHLELIAQIGRRRKVVLNLIGISQLHQQFEEDLHRLNKFIQLAREIFSQF